MGEHQTVSVGVAQERLGWGCRGGGELTGVRKLTVILINTQVPQATTRLVINILRFHVDPPQNSCGEPSQVAPVRGL